MRLGVILAEDPEFVANADPDLRIIEAINVILEEDHPFAEQNGICLRFCSCLVVPPKVRLAQKW